MRHVIPLWATRGSEAFEKLIPLKFIGRRHAEKGYAAEIDLVFLYGLDRLEPSYRSALADLGFKLHDASALFDEWRARVPSLSRFGSYELSCFLRWPVLERFFGAEPLIHYDADVVLELAPEEIERRTAGTTFVLQGCPALTVLGDVDWFRCYREQLLTFSNDIEGYSLVAWNQRTGWEASMRTRWAGSRFRTIIGSDQDLISHLIHVGGVPQTDPGEVRSRFNGQILFENALCLDDSNEGAPFTYVRANGADWINGERVALWHMQSEWVSYLSKFMVRETLRRAPRTLARGHGGIEGRLLRLARRFGGTGSRETVYRHFFETHDFSGVLNDRVWWKKGVFA